MRILFLIPDLQHPAVAWLHRQVRRTPLRRCLPRSAHRVPVVYGGTLNLMRHCLLARRMGADAALATRSGRDTYGDARGIAGLPFVRWADRRADDLCIIPDIHSADADRVAGRVVVYLQNPEYVRPDFDYRRPGVELWTDSPFMLAHVARRLPGKPALLVPNIIDPEAFPFIPQARREAGLLCVFPRKGPDFIAAVTREYARRGGRYWQAQAIDGLSFPQLAAYFRRPQAFLASADVEGCALPPQESMAAGIAVVGLDARGANFCMRHRETAFVTQTAEQTASALLELEAPSLREQLATRAFQFIQRFFPRAEPATHWRAFLGRAG